MTEDSVKIEALEKRVKELEQQQDVLLMLFGRTMDFISLVKEQKLYEKMSPEDGAQLFLNKVTQKMTAADVGNIQMIKLAMKMVL